MDDLRWRKNATKVWRRKNSNENVKKEEEEEEEESRQEALSSSSSSAAAATAAAFCWRHKHRNRNTSRGQFWLSSSSPPLSSSVCYYRFLIFFVFCTLILVVQGNKSNHDNRFVITAAEEKKKNGKIIDNTGTNSGGDDSIPTATATSSSSSSSSSSPISSLLNYWAFSLPTIQDALLDSYSTVHGYPSSIKTQQQQQQQHQEHNTRIAPDHACNKNCNIEKKTQQQQQQAAKQQCGNNNNNNNNNKQQRCQSPLLIGRRMRDLIKQISLAIHSPTAVAGMSESATLAAAAMAAAAAMQQQEQQQKQHEQQQQQQQQQQQKSSSAKHNEATTTERNNNANSGGLFTIQYSSMDTSTSRDRYKTTTTTTTTTTTRGEKSSTPSSDTFKSQLRIEAEMELMEGARLISGSLGLVSNAFGLLADTVRVVGDTTAGMTGSSVKLVGTFVKTISAGFDGAGSLLEGSSSSGSGGRRFTATTSSNGGAGGSSSGSTTTKRKKMMTSEKLKHRGRMGIDIYKQYREDNNNESRSKNLASNTRQVAANSVRLVGNVVRGLGDSLLMAGAATESITSSTAGVAEEAVRVLEDFAGSLSFVVHPKRWELQAQHEDRFSGDSIEYEHIHSTGHHHHQKAHHYDGHYDDIHYDRHHHHHREPSGFVSFGSHIDDDPCFSKPFSSKNRPKVEGDNTLQTEPYFGQSIVHVLFWTARQVAGFTSFALADTEGIPSIAPELFIILFLCYVTSVLTLSRGGRKERGGMILSDEETQQNDISEIDEGSTTTPEEDSSCDSGKETFSSISVSRTAASSPLQSPVPYLTFFEVEGQRVLAAGKLADIPVEKEERAEEDGHEEVAVASHAGSESGTAIEKDRANGIVILPFPKDRQAWLKTISAMRGPLFAQARMAGRILFHRRTYLIGFYVVCWLYLCRASRMRSVLISRRASVQGYRSAIKSIGTTSPSMVESVFWLNALLEHMWRVTYDPATEEGQKWVQAATKYPSFVRRAIEYDVNKNEKRMTRDFMMAEDYSERSNLDPPARPYLGLEPYIAASIGISLVDVLESTDESRPKEVAYASLYAFSLGSTPPLIHGIELRGLNNKGTFLHLNVDVDALLPDLSLILEVKLSSLEYALLPSTKVAIHALDVRLPLEVYLSVIPDYPFLSHLLVSFSHQPECKMRITPLSDTSGLRGVDLGSLPIISIWIQDAIREWLSEYVSPNYVSVDLGRYWTQSKTSETSWTSDQESKLHIRTVPPRASSLVMNEGLMVSSAQSREGVPHAMMHPLTTSSAHTLNSFELMGNLKTKLDEIK